MRRADEILPDTDDYDHYADEIQDQFVIGRPHVLKMRDERYPHAFNAPGQFMKGPRALGGTALGGSELGQQPGPSESATF